MKNREDRTMLPLSEKKIQKVGFDVYYLMLSLGINLSRQTFLLQFSARLYAGHWDSKVNRPRSVFSGSGCILNPLLYIVSTIPFANLLYQLTMKTDAIQASTSFSHLPSRNQSRWKQVGKSKSTECWSDLGNILI